MKIASYNINGIKARTNALITWLREAQPDVALLQEIKSVSENFPSDLFEDLGYNVAVNGQKSFNGVAILSKLPIEDIVTVYRAIAKMIKHDGWKQQLSATRQFVCICTFKWKPTPGLNTL